MTLFKFSMKKGKMGEQFMARDGKYILRAKAKQFPIKTAMHLLLKALRRQRAFVTYFWDKEQAERIAYIKNLYGGSPMDTTMSEALQIYNAVCATSKIMGAMAEVGVHKGGTARIISVARRESAKALHLFDTFGEGLPQPSEHDDYNWKKHAFKISESEFDAIKDAFASANNVHFHRGLFPVDTGHAVKDKRFSFVNLDVDLYQSTKDSLEFFYPRLNKGGIIISHDYRGSSGVTKAFDEFFVNKTEPVVELSTSQCLVVKV